MRVGMQANVYLCIDSFINRAGTTTTPSPQAQISFFIEISVRGLLEYTLYKYTLHRYAQIIKCSHMIAKQIYIHII